MLILVALLMAVPHNIKVAPFHRFHADSANVVAVMPEAEVGPVLGQHSVDEKSYPG